ncbi:MAG: hypothetical protein AAF579_12690 [Cyanobacteria bacterium P01_C01_bin.118]
MTSASWRLTLDRAVRYAVSDALASVKSHVYDLEYSQRRSTQEVDSWNNYLAELRDLHQRLLNLPSLEKAEWLSEEHGYYAPAFTPFVSGITDAKTNVRKVHNWLMSLSALEPTYSQSHLGDSSVSLEQEYYVHQVDQVLKQLQLLPTPGSKSWYAKYEPVVEVAKPIAEKISSAPTSHQSLVKAVA